MREKTDSIVNFAVNYSETNFIVNFAVNYSGLVHGKVHELVGIPAEH